MVRRLGVYRTFITGILVGLFYVVIVSEKASNLFIFSDRSFIDQQVLVLICSGILGGVLYTIIVDGSVELPKFSKDGYSFEAGLLGDILLGIAGAFILEFLTSSMQAPPDTSYVIYAAKGIIGGYGSKALMNVALNKFLSRFEEMKAEKEAAEEEVAQLQQQILEGQQLLDRLNTHIEQGLSEEELQELMRGIQHASTVEQVQIFKITKEFRSLSSRTEEFQERTERTIPVFEALVRCEPDNHAYHAQLAFAYKDIPQPNYHAAITQLNQAITLRGQWERSPTWKYELNRAIAHILLNLSERGQYQTPDDLTSVIIRDLLAVVDVRPLEHILRDAEKHYLPSPLLEWMINNRIALTENAQTRPLLQQLQETLGDERLRGEPVRQESETRPSDGVNPNGATPTAPAELPDTAPHSAASFSGSNGGSTTDAVTPSAMDEVMDEVMDDVIETVDRDEKVVQDSLNDGPQTSTDSNGESIRDGDGRSPTTHNDSKPPKPPLPSHQTNELQPLHPPQPIHTTDLNDIRATLQQEVTGVLHIQDWKPELFRAVKQGLVHLGFIDDDANFEEFQQAWAQFKASVGRGGAHLIGKDSATLFIKSLERIAQPTNDTGHAPGATPPNVPTEERGDIESDESSEPAESARSEQTGTQPASSESVDVEADGVERSPLNRPALALGGNSDTGTRLGRSTWDDVLLDVPTHGASSTTARQDGLTFNGLLASNQMARHDLPRVEKLMDRFRRAAAKYDVPAPLLAAIASRESRCGKLLDENGLGDHGNAFGIMQIDKRHHTPAGLGGDPASQAHIDQAAEILADNIKAVKAKHSDWDEGYVLKGAVAAYNFGVKNVKTQEGIDRGTTGDDYGADTVARAKFYITLFEA